ncbi:deubiquitinase OTUD6B [Drosophila pseudoobscura]|uniref:ubiquitinyl hydrolase 1 n=1 Tax=Drosophila pseudoobscura pseudoobscura TaxID=46245 RepID=A0A6I8UCC5_DROPS|nr:deubiquitinase OTUD6B [Drosophila pseudoobscura]
MASDGGVIFELESKVKEINLEDVASRHRRERKELQAKLQAMKKNAPKNNKTKRKEFLEEMSRLESELEQRQKIELQAGESKDVSELPKNQPVAEAPPAGSEPAKSEDDGKKQSQEPGTQQRVSKAQKRRDKKSREAREREAEIREELQNAANDGPSLKWIELQQITDKLASRQLALHSIASDGDCLYHAVRHQLIANALPGHSVQELRKETANYVRAQKDAFICYMTHPETGDLLNDEQFEQYCKDIEDNHAWGGHIELKAISSLLKVPIEVIQAEGAPTLLGQEEFGGAPLVLCYHRHIYQLGAHYNSTVPVEAEP